MNKIKRYHSSVWGAFLENATLQLDKALPVYEKNQANERDRNKRRKLVAVSENEPSCVAVVNCCIAIESFANSMAYSQNLTIYSPLDELPKKLQKIGLTDMNKLTAVRELTICRDSIVHGHIWTKIRSSDQDYNLKQVRSYLWKPFKKSLKKKYLMNVDIAKRTTNVYRFSIIPIDVSYVDAVKAFQVLISVMEDIFTKNNIIWRPTLYPHRQEGYSEATFQALNKKTTPEEWLKYFMGKLSTKDK